MARRIERSEIAEQARRIGQSPIACPSNPHIRKMLIDAGFECIDLALAFIKGIGVAFDQFRE